MTTESEVRTCVRCQSLLTSAGGRLVCPACALESALTSDGESDESAENEVFPRRFGDYELLGEIGRGGVGLVFKARQLSLDRIVALKVLLYGSFADKSGRRRFHAEAESAARLQHPNIVAVHEVGERDGVPYLTMDFVDGPDLGRMCDGRPLPASTAAQFLRDIARGVQAAHDTGVLHRDLKPSNILVGTDGRPRVTDFGLAKRDDAGASLGLTATGQVLGSPSYAPPEQAAGRLAEIGPRSDVYGLGAILYHLTTGRAPFVAATATQTLRLVLDTDPAPPRLLNPVLPRDLETICLKCLAKAPIRRYATAAEVADDVERFLQERPIRARPPNVFYRIWKFAQRHRAEVAATLAVFIALSVGLGIALIGFRRAVVQQRATNAARGQAEQLMGLLTQDLKPVLEKRGGLPQLMKTSEATVHYFDSLPLELRNTKTDRAHADALANLAHLRSFSLNDKKGAAEALDAALILRKKIAGENPNDPVAAAEWMWNEWERPRHIGDWALWHSYAWNAESLRKWRALNVRFPHSQRVQRGLAEVAFGFSILAPEFVKPTEALAAAIECRSLVTELLASHPDDQALVDLVGRSLSGLSTAYASVGDFAKAAEAGEQAVTYCTKALNADPANLTLRRSAADAARWLSYRVFSSSPERGREAEWVAREHYRILSEADPSDQEVHVLYAMTHLMETIYLSEVDGNRVAARAAIKNFDALLGDLPLRNPHIEVPQFRSENSLRLARIAATAGESVEARAMLQEARTRCADQLRLSLAGSFEQRLIWISNLQGMEWIARDMHDWPELQRLAQETMDEIDVGLRDQPTNEKLHLRRIESECFLGMALHGAGQTKKAIAALQDAGARLRKSPHRYLVSDTDEIQRSTDLCLLKALAQDGDTIRARALGDAILATFSPAETTRWRMREWRASVCVAVAGLCGPEYAVRRTALLDAAENLLTVSGAEARLTVWAREELATLRQLRAEAATGNHLNEQKSPGS